MKTLCASCRSVEMFRKAVYSEHLFRESPNVAVVGFLSPRFQRVFGTGRWSPWLAPTVCQPDGPTSRPGDRCGEFVRPTWHKTVAAGYARVWPIQPRSQPNRLRK